VSQSASRWRARCRCPEVARPRLARVELDAPRHAAAPLPLRLPQQVLPPPERLRGRLGQSLLHPWEPGLAPQHRAARRRLRKARGAAVHPQFKTRAANDSGTSSGRDAQDQWVDGITASAHKASIAPGSRATEVREGCISEDPTGEQSRGSCDTSSGCAHLGSRPNDPQQLAERLHLHAQAGHVHPRRHVAASYPANSSSKIES
jgi:hypothetical protein